MHERPGRARPVARMTITRPPRPLVDVAVLHDRLMLRAAADAPPCVGRDDWTDDRPDIRERAARLCIDACRLVGLCRNYGEQAQEPWGVFGGVDRSPPTRTTSTTTDHTDERTPHAHHR